MERRNALREALPPFAVGVETRSELARLDHCHTRLPVVEATLQPTPPANLTWLRIASDHRDSDSPRGRAE
jgi:hypothetical protein